ncbi:hypothetical protein LguiB_002280 [Lonicera macranthoides]
MKEFKDIPSNKRYIEGSIAESYIVAESVRYCMEYMPNPLEGNHRRTHEAFLEEDGEFSDTGPLLDDKIMTLETHQFQQIRRWVLFRLHVDGLKEYYSDYQQHLASSGKGKGVKMTKIQEQTSFIPWAYDKAHSIMSSAGNSQQPSRFSAPQPSSQSSGTGKEKAKLPIIIGPTGIVVGANSRKWSNRVGDYVRSCIPVKYSDFRQVPQNFKDDVWRNLMNEFELPIPEEVARPQLEKGWSQKFRTYKSTLRKGLQIEIEEAPRGIDPNHWKEFTENENKAKKIEQKKKNAENRGKLEYSHCLGRYSYAAKTHEMEEAMPENLIDRVDAWLAGHQKEDGTVLPSAKPLYDQVKEIKTKRKSGEDGSSSTIQNDGLTQVFGKDMKGRLRGVGSHISKKQMVIVEIEKAKGVAKNKEKTKDDAFKDEVMASVQSQMQTINADFKSDLMLSMQNLLQSFMNGAKESSPPVVVTPRSDLGSNSVHRPPNIIQNLDNCFAGRNWG